MTDFFFFYCSQTASSGSTQTIGGKTFMELDSFPITDGNVTKKDYVKTYVKENSFSNDWIRDSVLLFDKNNCSLSPGIDRNSKDTNFSLFL